MAESEVMSAIQENDFVIVNQVRNRNERMSEIFAHAAKNFKAPIQSKSKTAFV